MLNKKIIYWAVTSALAGFLFGFDTAVISGGEQTIQRYWNLSDVMLGQMVAMALYGTIIGALAGGYPAQYFGTHWIFAALIAGNFVYFESQFGGAPIFAFFAFMMVIQLLFVWKIMPETKGVSLEQMEVNLGLTPELVKKDTSANSKTR